MNLDEKPQFMKLLATMFGAHGKPLSEGMIAGYWKGLEKMSLIAFERCCDVAIERLSHAERGISKTPTVAEIWDIKRGSLRQYEAPKQAEAPYPGDAWDIAANQLLMAYISTAKHRKIDYAPDAVMNSATKLQVGEHTIAIGKILSKHASAWARDMREDRAQGGKRDGKADWLAIMRDADITIRSYLVHCMSRAA